MDRLSPDEVAALKLGDTVYAEGRYAVYKATIAKRGKLNVTLSNGDVFSKHGRKNGSDTFNSTHLVNPEYGQRRLAAFEAQNKRIGLVKAVELAAQKATTPQLEAAMQALSAKP